MDDPKNTSRINMKHGFMKSIIKNQVDRDNYDKEVKSTKPTHKRQFFHGNRHKKPEQAVYVPPYRKDDDKEDEKKEETQENMSDSEEEDNMPKTLFCFEFEDKDGKVYKQYVKEGVRAEILAQRMGYDRSLPPAMIKALEGRLQEEIDKRIKKGKKKQT